MNKELWQAHMELEDKILRITTGTERAHLMAGDLVDEYFSPLSKEVGKENRELMICVCFEQNRIRAEILRDILSGMHKAAAELTPDIKRSHRKGSNK